MFRVSPAILQTFIDTPNYVLEVRVRYFTIHIPNIFCDGKGKAFPLQAYGTQRVLGGLGFQIL
jgi:hypothetical protein